MVFVSHLVLYFLSAHWQCSGTDCWLSVLCMNNAAFAAYIFISISTDSGSVNLMMEAQLGMLPVEEVQDARIMLRITDVVGRAC